MDGISAAPAEHELPIVFTGSGSEYFRIWIVNLLLTLATLGLYYPWAKVRRLRYFFANTQVAGQGFDFHGKPGRMLRGYLLVGALLGLYSVAGKVSAAAGLAAFAIVAALWPALFRASLQFRLANTSWRGLRFHFKGSMAGAYRTMLPLFVPGLLLLAAGLFVEQPLAGDAAPRELPPAAAVTLGAGMLSLPLLGPLLWWMLKRYQHGHYALGDVQTHLRGGPGAFYGVLGKTLGVGLLVGICCALLAALIGFAGAFAFRSEGEQIGRNGAVAAAMVGVFVSYIGMLVVVWPFATSRMQNLVWTRTESPELRFASALRFWPLLRLSMKNLALTIVTLGLYWPFAAVATARLRLQAVTVLTQQSPDAFANATHASHADAAGDAAGDLLGIDIGL